MILTTSSALRHAKYTTNIRTTPPQDAASLDSARHHNTILNAATPQGVLRRPAGALQKLRLLRMSPPAIEDGQRALPLTPKRRVRIPGDGTWTHGPARAVRRGTRTGGARVPHVPCYSSPIAPSHIARPSEFWIRAFALYRTAHAPRSVVSWLRAGGAADLIVLQFRTRRVSTSAGTPPLAGSEQISEQMSESCTLISLGAVHLVGFWSALAQWSVLRSIRPYISARDPRLWG